LERTTHTHFSIAWKKKRKEKKERNRGGGTQGVENKKNGRTLKK